LLKIPHEQYQALYAKSQQQTIHLSAVKTIPAADQAAPGSSILQCGSNLSVGAKAARVCAGGPHHCWSEGHICKPHQLSWQVGAQIPVRSSTKRFSIGC
jgi:hypothetical protein